MKVYKSNILIAILICVLFTLILYLNLYNLDIITLLVLSFSPLVISVLISLIISKKTNLDKTNPLVNALIFAIGNLFCSFIEWFLLFKNNTIIENILKSSQKYNSEYVQISENNNPVMAIILIFAFSLAINYLIYKKRGNIKEE